MDGEQNDVFYVFTVQSSGILRFTLTPNNSNNDYDWSVFNMTDADCSQLYPQAVNLQVSCNSYGNLGYNGPTGINTTLGNLSNCNGPSLTNGPPFNKDLPVLAGDYTLTIAGDIRDLCANVALYESYPFQLSGINAPVAGAGNDTTVTNGAIITLNGSSTGGAAPLSFHWEPASLLVNPNVEDPTTINMGATTEFSLTVTDNLGCADVDEVLISVIGGPLGVTASADPGTICKGASVQLLATGTGGSGNYSYSWSSIPPGFSSTLPDPLVFPVSNTVYYVAIADGFSTSNNSTSVTVHPLPAAQAGPDISIPFGTYTTLNGSASGGSGNYNWRWSSNPPGFSSTLQKPATNNLEVTTMFSLRATDQATGCQSSPDDVLVTVTGSPLSVTPIALPAVICQGVSTQLAPMTSGGTGIYTYSWTSVPAGFTSSDPGPVVNPMETTSYYVTVNDGFNIVSGNVNVIVNPKPQIHLGPPDTMICIFDTVVLDAGNPGAIWYWSNGATTRTIKVSSTGIGYDLQTYSVKVVNEFACTDSAIINVIFTFAACTGLEEKIMDMETKLYPNPTTGILTLTISPVRERIHFSLFSLVGQELISESLDPSDPGTFTGQYDLTGFPRGVYLVRITGDKESVIRKVVLE